MKLQFKIKGIGKDAKKAKRNFDRFFKKLHRKSRCRKCGRVHIISI